MSRFHFSAMRWRLPGITLGNAAAAVCVSFCSAIRISLTRMGHPHDPQSHSHHNSVWISHNSVNGISFWEDRGKGRSCISASRRLDDGDQSVCAFDQRVDR